MSVITSIKGLQNLTNLTDFRADWNGLQSVNLSGLTNLVYVDISDNNISGTGANSLTSVNLSGCTAIEELRLDDSNFSGGFPNLSGLDSLIYMDFDQCGITGSVDISNHPVLEGFDFGGNTGLTELIISNAQPLGGNGYELLLGNCALTQTAVDNILVALSESAVTNGYVDLAGGTSASPSQIGIDAINVLNDKSWSFDCNLTATNYTVSNQSSLTRDCELFPNLGLYSLQSNPLEVVRFYNNSNLTSPFLGTADAFFTFVLFDQPENVYTANIDPVTGDVSNVQLCPTPTTTTTTTTVTPTTTTTTSSTSTTTTTTTAAPGYALGELALGGMIAYILQPGDPGYVAGEQHGLVVTVADVSESAEWGCTGTLISGADGTALGTGAQNTVDIVAGCATAGIAAKLCLDLVQGGYNDWYLPSKDELNKLYLSVGQGAPAPLTNVAGFADFVYWSSTESTANGAWYQGFDDGIESAVVKSFTFYVRAIRSF